MAKLIKRILNFIKQLFGKIFHKPKGITAKCEICQKPATSHYTWGLYEYHAKDNSYQRAILCPDCGAELKRIMKGSLSAGLMHLVIKRV